MNTNPEWKLVPVAPTEEMHAAAVRTVVKCSGNANWPPRVYAAMLAAAPPCPAAVDAPEKMTRRQLRRNCTDAKDAERYRGLRAMACSASAAERAKAFDALSSGEWCHEKDAAVDAAIAQQSQRRNGGEA